MIIIINLTIHVTSDPLPHQLADEKTYQFFKRISERDNAEFEAKVQETRRGQIQVICDRCGIEIGWYDTPGKAKMGLSGHQRWCKRSSVVSGGNGND